MKNIVYNKFIELYSEHNIDILAANTYKIALVTNNYTPDKETHNNFFECIQNPGFEAVDGNNSYVKGGKYVTFSKLEGSSTDGILQYTVGKVIWKNVYISNLKHAVVYRESDGLLIACYTLNNTINPSNNDLILDWDNIAMLSISSITNEEEIIIDSNLNTTSTHTIQNRIVTEVFKNLGTVFTDDDRPIPYVEETEGKEGEWENGLVYITMLNTDTVNSIFDEVMGN